MNFSEIGGIKPPRTKTAKETFDALVASAERTFGTQGYFKTTIGDITGDAGLAAGTFYLYFESKYAMYEWVLAKYQADLKAHLSENTKGLKTRYEKERAGLKTFLLSAIENPLCYHLVWESLYVNPELFKKYYSTFADGYIHALAHSKDELTTDDYKTLSYLLMGINNFVGLQVMFDSTAGDELDRVIDTVMQVLENGMFVK